MKPIIIPLINNGIIGLFRCNSKEISKLSALLSGCLAVILKLTEAQRHSHGLHIFTWDCSSFRTTQFFFSKGVCSFGFPFIHYIWVFLTNFSFRDIICYQILFYNCILPYITHVLFQNFLVECIHQKFMSDKWCGNLTS